jgi:hypothetical protein
MEQDTTDGELYIINVGLHFLHVWVPSGGFIIHEEAVFDRATADWTECSTGGRLDANELSDDISPLLVRGVTNDIDVLHHDVRSASSFKGTIYLGDLDGRPALRVDLLIEIVLVFRLAHSH